MRFAVGRTTITKKFRHKTSLRDDGACRSARDLDSHPAIIRKELNVGIDQMVRIGLRGSIACLKQTAKQTSARRLGAGRFSKD
jgi:hypothetical protein